MATRNPFAVRSWNCEPAAAHASMIALRSGQGRAA
jgi:hypothetical protein